MARYQVDQTATQVVSLARSSIHDTRTVWNKIAGTIEADVDSIAGATAKLTVDMRAFDAGDFLKNRKLKKDLEVARYPEAQFELSGLDDIERKAEGSFEATARGVIRWRGRAVDIAATGKGTLSGSSLEATASFDLDVTHLGIAPPKFLMFKVEKVVTVEVTLRATAC